MYIGTERNVGLRGLLVVIDTYTWVKNTSTHFKYYRGEHILSDAKSALRENAKMQTRADEPLKVRLRKAIFTCLYLFTSKT